MFFTTVLSDVFTDPGGGSVIRVLCPPQPYVKGSCVIVDADRCAFVMLNGRVYPFGEGRHSLPGGVFPIVSQLTHLAARGDVGQEARIYFTDTRREFQFTCPTGAVNFRHVRHGLTLRAFSRVVCRCSIDPMKLIRCHNGFRDVDLTEEALSSIVEDIVSGEAVKVLEAVVSDGEMTSFHSRIEAQEGPLVQKLRRDLAEEGVVLRKAFFSGGIQYPEEDVKRLQKVEDMQAMRDLLGPDFPIYVLGNAPGFDTARDQLAFDRIRDLRCGDMNTAAPYEMGGNWK